MYILLILKIIQLIKTYIDLYIFTYAAMLMTGSAVGDDDDDAVGLFTLLTRASTLKYNYLFL